MKLPEEGMLLRIFVGESDKYKGKALYEHIVIKARELNLAGATVLRGIMGFGADSRMHSAGIYGMNFNPEVSFFNMPELNWKFGYIFAWIVMGLMALGMI